MTPPRNPHAGLPITDDDATIAAALEDVSIPTLLLSMVHITGCLDLLLSSGAKALEPRPEVHDDYYRRAQRELKGLVWSHPSIRHSWFKNPEGDIHVLSPWRLVDYWTWTQRPDPTDYRYT